MLQGRRCDRVFQSSQRQAHGPVQPGFGCLGWHQLVRICHLTLRLSYLLFHTQARRQEVSRWIWANRSSLGLNKNETCLIYISRAMLKCWPPLRDHHMANTRSLRIWEKRHDFMQLVSTLRVRVCVCEDGEVDHLSFELGFPSSTSLLENNVSQLSSQHQRTKKKKAEENIPTIIIHVMNVNMHWPKVPLWLESYNVWF